MRADFGSVNIIVVKCTNGNAGATWELPMLHAYTTGADRPDHQGTFDAAGFWPDGTSGTDVYTGGAGGAPHPASKHINDWAPVTVTSVGIAFNDNEPGSNPDTITDSGSGFSQFQAADVISVAGTASNDGSYTIVSSVAGTITLADGVLTNESAGSSFTITKTSGDHDGNTTHDVPEIHGFLTEKQQRYTLTDPSGDINLSGDEIAVVAWSVHNCNFAAKVMTLGIGFFENSALDRRQLVNTTDANYNIMSTVFETAPDGTQWDGDSLAAVVIIASEINQDAANNNGNLTAMWCEAFEWDNDPEPIPIGSHSLFINQAVERSSFH